MLTAISVFVLAVLALILDLGLNIIIRPGWPVPPLILLLVLFYSLRRGEIGAMVMGWILGYLFDALNQGNVGMTSLLLVSVAFSPWPFRKARELGNRFIQALLCVANVAASFAIVVVFNLGRGVKWGNLGLDGVIREGLILSCLCLFLLFLLFPLMERFVKPAEEMGA